TSETWISLIRYSSLSVGASRAHSPCLIDDLTAAHGQHRIRSKCKWMRRKQHEISVHPGLQRTDTVCDPQDLRRIACDGPQGFGLVHPLLRRNRGTPPQILERRLGMVGCDGHLYAGPAQQA